MYWNKPQRISDKNIRFFFFSGADRFFCTVQLQYYTWLLEWGQIWRFCVISLFWEQKNGFQRNVFGRRQRNTEHCNFIILHRRSLHSQNEMNGITSSRDCYCSGFIFNTAALWQSAGTPDNKLHWCSCFRLHKICSMINESILPINRAPNSVDWKIIL